MTATTLLPRLDWLSRLRSIMVLRPGQRVVHVPGIGVRASRRAVSSGATDWWLAGGAPAPVAVYQPIGAASLAASYVNLVNPGTYDAAPGIAPTFDAAGWVFTGANSTGNWLDTGLVAPDSQNRAVLVRFSNGLSGIRFVIDNYSATANRMEIATTNTVIEYGNGNYQQRSPTLTAGVIGFAGVRCYRNGSDEGGADIGAYSGVNTQSVRVGYSYAGGGLYRFGGKIQAIAVWDTSTGHATWMPAVSAAMAAL